MSDSEKWVTSESPASLLYTLEQMKALDSRRSLLFSCGCYRLIWQKIGLPSVRKAVEKGEDRADRKLSKGEFAKLRYPSGRPARNTLDWHLQLSVSSLVATKVIPTHIAWLIRAALEPAKHQNADKWEKCKQQADLVRDIFGNPFRPVSLDPRWQTADVVDLARAIYDDRAVDRLPILADVLMDAGCDNDDIIQHCRGPGPHVRGCWVVDLILGKS